MQETDNRMDEKQENQAFHSLKSRKGKKTGDEMAFNKFVKMFVFNCRAACDEKCE